MTLREQVRTIKSLPPPDEAVQILKATDVTPRELALSRDISPATVRRYLAGHRVKHSTAIALSEAFAELRTVV